jgi:hypothetical protein
MESVGLSIPHNYQISRKVSVKEVLGGVSRPLTAERRRGGRGDRVDRVGRLIPGLVDHNSRPGQSPRESAERAVHELTARDEPEAH